MTTAARYAAAVTYTRIVGARSASSIICCYSDRTTFDISASVVVVFDHGAHWGVVRLLGVGVTSAPPLRQ
eukprot:8335963-Pyramimonas_sp.AAC.1